MILDIILFIILNVKMKKIQNIDKPRFSDIYGIKKDIEITQKIR